MILAARRERAPRTPLAHRAAARGFAWLLQRPRLFRAAGTALRRMPRGWLARLTPAWSRQRAMPQAPARSFKQELRVIRRRS
jgi:L-lactate dehydrogenase complex protein LldF